MKGTLSRLNGLRPRSAPEGSRYMKGILSARAAWGVAGTTRNAEISSGTPAVRGLKYPEGSRHP